MRKNHSANDGVTVGAGIAALFVSIPVGDIFVRD